VGAIEMLENFGIVLWCMRLTGLYHRAPEKDATLAQRVFSGRTYCLVITILLWLNLMRYIPVFFIGVFGLNPFEMLTFTWFLQGAINAALCFRACTKRDHLEEFDCKWKTFKVDADMKNAKLVFEKKEMHVWIALVLTFAFIFLFLDFFCILTGVAAVFDR
jgi:hypothetical protein